MNVASRRRLGLFVAPILLVAAVSGAPVVHADDSRLRIRFEGDVGSMVSHDQRSWLGFSRTGAAGAATFGYAVGRFVLEARLSGAVFPSDSRGAGAVADAAGGVAWNLPFSSALSLDLYAHLGAAWTGPIVLAKLDVGARFAWHFDAHWSLGPTVTYNQLIWDGGAAASEGARYLVGGVVLTWRPSSVDEPRVQIIHRTEERRVLRVVHHYPPPPPAPPGPELDRLLDAALPVLHREQTSLVPPVLFVFDSTEMIPCGEVALFTAREILARTTGEIVIEGHADAQGEGAYNEGLSRARAERVRAWLVAHGIEAGRLRIEAFGEQAPLEGDVAPQTTPDQFERRVTFRTERVESNVSHPGGDANLPPLDPNASCGMAP